MVLEKVVKIDGWTDGRTTDSRWSEKLTWASSSGELLKRNEADKNKTIFFYIFVFFPLGNCIEHRKYTSAVITPKIINRQSHCPLDHELAEG